MTKYKPGGSYGVIKPILPFVCFFTKNYCYKKEKRLTFDGGWGQQHLEHNSRMQQQLLLLGLLLRVAFF